jgi:aminopeptidase N
MTQKKRQQKNLVKHRLDYMPPSHFIDTVDLTIDIGEQNTIVTNKMRVKKNSAYHKSDKQALILCGEKQKLQWIKINDRPLTTEQYIVDEEKLTLADLPSKFVLEVQSIIKPQDNTALMGLYQSSNMFCTQCEPEGFRNITYFLDRPDVLSSYTTTIIADKKQYPTLLSNGNLIAQGEMKGGRHWTKWQDPFKKPCYLFAMIAGDLEYLEDHFITRSKRKITLRIFTEKGNKDKCKFAMHSLQKAMRWDEKNYGREYDLDIFMIVAVSDFNAGAMENKGLNIFNTKYILAQPHTATDVDYANIDRVIAHEYFHNWTGDRITCRDWFQLSLKEGLTVFRDQTFAEDIGSAAVTRIDEVSRLRELQFAEDAGPLAHPVRPDSYIKIDNFYTMTVYEKGAEVIRMIRTILGRDKFRKGMDLYFERFDGQAVTCDDFVQAMEDASSIDLTQFKLWYSQAGTPELQVTTRYDAVKQQYFLTVKQYCPPTPGQEHKQAMHIPLAVGIGTQNKLLNVTKEQQTFVFDNVSKHPVPSLLRGFSAPVKLYYDYTANELAFLMAEDSDEFSRWEASQIYASRIILGLVRQTEVITDEFIAAFKKVLLNTHLDKALIAQMLQLPSELYLGELMEVVDPGAIHVARKKTQFVLATKLKSEFLQLFQLNAKQKSYQYNSKDAARRSLQNICLHYLMQVDDDSMRDLCMQQFQCANNMTDKMAALIALANVDCPQRLQALTQFYAEYQQEPLVIDKWFAVQAMSTLPSTLHEVKKLLTHEMFNIKNPNRARSLLYSFASLNPVRFHDISGEGYKLLTDQVLILDAFNPKVAARLVVPLTKWRRYNAARQGLMREQLEKILTHKKLSNDVYELVSRSTIAM